MDFFIQNAYAQGAQQADPFGFLLPMIIIFAAFYFLLIRPQQKKQKETKAMLESVKKGDKAITSGGMHGVVVGLSENTVTLKIADKVNVTFQRSAIVALPGKKS